MNLQRSAISHCPASPLSRVVFAPPLYGTARCKVGIWRDSQDMTVARIVARLARKLDRAPTFRECQAAAQQAALNMPIGMADVRLHDLRHAFASVAAASGMGLPIIGKMLGHSQAATTARYAHLAPDPVKIAAAAVAGKSLGRWAERLSASDIAWLRWKGKERRLTTAASALWVIRRPNESDAQPS
jgi:integrase-like protein